MTTAQSLREECTVLEPGEPGWDAARRAFNLAVDQRPALIALPLDERDVIAAVQTARERGLRVVPQCAGHRAERGGDLADAMLLRTTAVAGVEIDVRAHRARVRAGARWADVCDRASFLGLAPAAGFLRTAGVITALELALHPAEDLYAGALFFSPERAVEVLHAWREWTAMAPAEITSVARLMRFADRHDVPELVRGRSFTIIEAAHLGTDAVWRRRVDALRTRFRRVGWRRRFAGGEMRLCAPPFPLADAACQRAAGTPIARRSEPGR